MRVAVYYPWIYLKSGIERSIIEIKRRSRHDIRIFTNHYDAEATFPELKAMDVVELDRVSVKRGYSAVFRAALTILRTHIDLDDIDAILVCCDGLGPLLTFRHRSRPIVNLCFTPLRAAYDHAYRERLLARGSAKRLLGLAAETTFRALDHLAWRNFDAVICIAETVRIRVAAGKLYPAARLEVVYPGVDASRIVPGLAFEPFFLLPGRIMWTKNIELALEAFSLFLEQAPPALQHFRLHVAGMVDAKSELYYERLVASVRGSDRVTFETHVSDARLRDLYSRCWGVLTTAFNEDFGLTAVEAMAYGKPVIASDRGGFRETVADGVTGYLVEPNPLPYAGALRRLAEDPSLARRLGAGGPERAQRFTWEKFVTCIDDRLQAVARTR